MQHSVPFILVAPSKARSSSDDQAAQMIEVPRVLKIAGHPKRIQAIEHPM
jgi:hypothetical protein